MVDGDFTTLYAPREPAITGVSSDGSRLTLAVDTLGEPDVTLDIFRDGQRVATGVSGDTWTDPASSPGTSHCYAVASVYASGNASHHSPPACWWGANFERIQTLSAGDFSAVGGTLVFNWGRQHYEGWGAADHTLEVSFTAGFTGSHLLQAIYGNGAGPVNTGVTAAHKRVEVLDPSGALVGEGSWVMPHLGTWDAWEDSNFVRAELQAGTAYRLRISDAPNMSRLQRHDSYTGSGGGVEAYNFVNIAEIKVLSLGG